MLIFSICETGAASYDGLLKTWDDLSWIGTRPWGYLRCQGCFILLCIMDSSPNSVPPAQEVGIFTSSPHPPQGPSEGGLTSSPPFSICRGGPHLLLSPRVTSWSKPLQASFGWGAFHILPPPFRNQRKGVWPPPPPIKGGTSGSSFTCSFFSSLHWVFPSLGLPFAGSSIHRIFLPPTASSLRCIFPLLGLSFNRSFLHWVFPSMDLSLTGSSLNCVFPSLGLPFAGSSLHWVFHSVDISSFFPAASLRWVYHSPDLSSPYCPSLGLPCAASSLRWVFPSMDLSFTGSSLNCVFPSLGFPFAGSSLHWGFPSLGLPFTGSSLRWVFSSMDLSFTGSSLRWVFHWLGLFLKAQPVCGVDPWTPLQTAQIAGQEQCVVFYKMVYRKGDGETTTSICSTTTAQEKIRCP